MPYDMKKKSTGSSSKGDGEKLSAFGEYADDAFAALKAGDKAAFRAALKSAIKACYADEG